MASTAKRVAAATGATVLTLGLATPALAHEPAEGRSLPAGHAPDRGVLPGASLAEIKARVTQAIGYRLAWLDRAQERVSGSDRLTAEQKTVLLTRLQAAEDALTALRAKIAAATTVEQVRAALRESGLRGFLGRGWHHGWRAGGWSGWGEHRGDAAGRPDHHSAKQPRSTAAGADRDGDRDRARHERDNRGTDRRGDGDHRGDHRWNADRDGDRWRHGDRHRDGGHHRGADRAGHHGDGSRR
jgi:hypothetical protein